MPIESTLKERQSSHGSWETGCKVSQGLKKLLNKNAEVRPDFINEALDRICMKLSRIATGDSQFIDHWHDIAGYATLTEQTLEKYVPNNNKEKA